MNPLELRRIKAELSSDGELPRMENNGGAGRIPTFPSRQDHHTGHDESARIKKAIQLALEPILSDEHMEQIICLYEHDFPAHRPFSLPAFCQRLVETLPEVDLTAEVRLTLLKTIRQSADQLGKNPPNPSTDVRCPLHQDGPASKAAEHSTRSVPPLRQPGTNLSRDDALNPGLATTEPIEVISSASASRPVRKPTQFKGVYQRKYEDTEPVFIIVENVSVGGVKARLLSADTIWVGDVLIVQFGLDQPKRLMIRASVCVRWVEGNVFGAQFVNPDKLKAVLTDLIHASAEADEPAIGQNSSD